jgi:hypothetical protein
VVLSPSGLVVCGVVVLAGGTGMPTDGSGFGVLDPLSLLSGLVAGLGEGVDSELVRLRLRRGVGLSSVDSTTRLRLRRGVGLSSVDSTTRLRLRRGVGLSSVDSTTRLRFGVDSGVDST